MAFPQGTAQGISYQAVAYDSEGFEISNQDISVRLGILLGGVDAEASYTEVHSVTTDDFGLFSLVISQGETLDTFSSINWEEGAYLKVEVDEDLDGVYTLMGVNSFNYVPYSLFAENIPVYYSNQISNFLSEVDSLNQVVSFVSLFLGCNDDEACNFNIEAIMIYDNCEYPDYGYDCDGNCIDTDGDEVCDLDEIEGCSDESACNYVVGASNDDGSCEYQEQYYDCFGVCLNDQDGDGICDELEQGCTDDTAENFDSQASIDDGTCFYNVACPYPEYFEYSPNSPNYSIEMCLTFIVEGCTDSSSVSFDQLANFEDGSCVYYGCMDTIADNYDPQANQEDLTCLYYGCTDSYSDNYWSTANVDDGSCYRYGCMLDDYPNYDHIATIDDGSCSIEVEIGDSLQGGIVFYIDETGQHGLLAAYEDFPGVTDEWGWVYNKYEWGCMGIDVGALGSDIGAGYQNSYDIIDGCLTQDGSVETAALMALANPNNYNYNDWYLPSAFELQEMWYTIGAGNGNVGGFNNMWYWSSTEFNSDRAIIVSPGGNSSTPPTDDALKSNQRFVRPIRSF